MTEIKDRIEELNKALQQEIANLQTLEGIKSEATNKIISIRGGIAELSRIQEVFDKVQKEFDEELDEKTEEEELIGGEDEESRDESE